MSALLRVSHHRRLLLPWVGSSRGAFHMSVAALSHESSSSSAVMKEPASVKDSTCVNVNLQDPTQFLLSVCFFQYRVLDTPGKIHDAMRLVQQLESVGVKGRTYVSIEGINAQLAVPYSAFSHVLERIESPPFKALFDVPNLTLNVEPVFLKPQVP